jgi:DNA (cytosine-5)-methyltransferase 1
VARVDPFIAVSIFSGIGALDLGLEQAGFCVRVQAEKNRWARQTLAANRKRFRSRYLTQFGDVCTLAPEGIVEAAQPSKKSGIALLAGGPPCQSYSSAGTRRGWNDERGNLILEYLRLLKGIKPRGFIFENVVGFTDATRMVNGQTEPLFLWFLRQAIDAGYAVSWGILDAADFGAPQYRERFIVLGSLSAYAPAFPTPTHGPRGVEPHRTLGGALAGLEGDSPYDMGGIEFSDSKRAIMQLVPAGGNWRDLPPGMMTLAMGGLAAEQGGKTGYWRRLAWDKPSPTVMNRPDHRGTCFCHPDKVRPLTVREFARLQCLPDAWRVEGPTLPRYRQVGDAVPVPLGLALGRAMRAHLLGSKLARLDGWPVNSMPRPGRHNRKVGLWGWSYGGRLRIAYEPPRTASRHQAALLRQLQLLPAAV